MTLNSAMQRSRLRSEDTANWYRIIWQKSSMLGPIWMGGLIDAQ
jgi:hypothetical protein